MSARERVVWESKKREVGESGHSQSSFLLLL